MLIVVWVLFGLGVIDVPFLSSDSDGDGVRLSVDDGLQDCRKVGRDTGDRCDVGADLETITVQRLDDQTIAAELELTEAPDLGSGAEWTVELFADTQNAYTESGIICVLSNIVDGSEPGKETAAYALEFRFSQEHLGAEACDGRLQGSSARFTIDVTGQPDEAEFRLVGVVRVDFPSDTDQPGSEDDFLVRTSLADLQG